MEVGLILAHRYPDEGQPPQNYEVRVNADGEQYISYWNSAVLGQQPSVQTLRSWWLDAEKWGRRLELAKSVDRQYDLALAPDGIFTKLERDEVLEKKAANKAIPGSASLLAQETNLSSQIDTLRANWKNKKQAINSVTQGANETLEDTVARLRSIN